MIDNLTTLSRESLETLQQAVAAILSHAEAELLPAPLESELYIFRDRIGEALSAP